MQTWVVIASGQSLNKDEVEYVKSKKDSLAGVIAISNVGLDMAPWADVLVSSDSAWWLANKKAFDFKGKKVSRHNVGGTEKFDPFINSANSGLFGMHYALKQGAKKILLLGFDMHGTHYFGPHPAGLKNTTNDRFKAHIRQFNHWNGCEVVNCTLGSAIEKFPKQSIYDMI